MGCCKAARGVTLRDIKRNSVRWFKESHCGVGDLATIFAGITILVFGSIIVSFLLGYFWAVAQVTSQPDYVYYYPRWEKQLNRSDPNEADIMETREYQIRPSITLFKDRQLAINQLLNLL